MPAILRFETSRPLTHRGPLGLFSIPPFTLTFNGQDLLQNPRFQGGLRAVGGLTEMMAGAVGGVATAWSGVGLVAGGLAVAHGTDNYVAGMRQLFTGEYTETVTSQSLQRLGMSAETANHIDNGLSIVGTLGGAAVVQSTQHVPRFVSFLGTSVTEGMQLNRFHQAASNLSPTGQGNIRILRGWAKSKGWEKLPNPAGGPEKWGTYVNGQFEWRLRIKPEPSMRPGLESGSALPRFDARIGNSSNYQYINPFNGKMGNKDIGTHLPLE